MRSQRKNGLLKKTKQAIKIAENEVDGPHSSEKRFNAQIKLRDLLLNQ
jgi:hypothetical protein